MMAVVDPAKVRPVETPSTWDYELVAERLVEAANVIRRMPMRLYPKRFGNSWPQWLMTGAERDQLLNELQAAGKLEEWQRERNRIHIQPSGREIELAEEALGWLPRYLGNDTMAAQIVGTWANKTFSYDARIDDDIPSPVRAALREISRGLRHDRVPVRRPRRE
jgi:hypothetical protein